ncbi:MAG TPA: glycosyltransferase family 39 protein [Flavisolibacter sp.]|nr:glycosyltransferase family 39 protein [Flavisolibacter sp.]
MTNFFKKHHRILFYTGWFVLGLLQSIFTELQDDEAYYWVFSRYLDLGYFDHPPLIALLIKMGTVLLGGEVGVRIVPLILNTATLYITERLTEKKEPFLFYAIALSVAVLQISGFVAVPDIPLMFFTALFLLLYRNFLRNGSWGNTLLLGLVAAALLYSKYHGVLVILFVLLSNLKLLQKTKLYVAGMVALLLFVPHLYWQMEHNWISFRYHLFESNVNPYKFSYTTDYILGQLLLAGPLAGFILWPAAFLYRSKNSFDRALKFTAVGFFLFFLLSTLKGKVEPNWTSPAIIPVMVLAHQYMLQKDKARRTLWRLLPITLFIVLAFRVIMIVDIVPAQAIVERYHAWKGWPQEMKARTKSLPVVFNNSYQRASKYWFYTGQMSYSLNKFDDRRNNYNFWPVEDSLLGRPVYILDIYDLHEKEDSIKTPLYTVGYKYDSSYHSFTKIRFRSNDYTIKAADSLRISFDVDVPQHYKTYLQQYPDVDPKIAIVIFRGRDRHSIIEAPFTLQQVLRQNIRQWIVSPSLPQGDYFFRFGIMSDSRLYTHNSEKINLRVE